MRSERSAWHGRGDADHDRLGTAVADLLRDRFGSSHVQVCHSHGLAVVSQIRGEGGAQAAASA